MKLTLPLILATTLVAGEAWAYTPAPTRRPTLVPTATPIPPPTAIPTAVPTPTPTPTPFNTPIPPTPTRTPTPTPTFVPGVPTPTPAPPNVNLVCSVVIPLTLTVSNSALGQKVELTLTAAGYDTVLKTYTVDTTPTWIRELTIVGRPPNTLMTLRLLSAAGVEIQKITKTP